MLDPFQKTILKEVVFKGIGLHSGLKTKVKILPAAENHGIVFKRADLNKNNVIKANFENVSSTKLCTTLQNKFEVSVSTVEHLLAALYITGIDNALIEISNSEVPIMDGSSKEFVETITCAGVKTLNAKRKYLSNMLMLKNSEFNFELHPFTFMIEKIPIALAKLQNLISMLSQKRFYLTLRCFKNVYACI